jgi:DNA-binding LytR/AlgR family response regulator
MNLRCLVVDDEPLAMDIVEDYIKKVDYLTLAGKCQSAVKALEVLHSDHIDILFLDIQMPELTGFDLLESASKQPWVIFTTAYNHYAVQSYDIDAVDYLLKPFSFSRFLKAVEKVVAYNGAEPPQPPLRSDKGISYIFASTGGRTTRVAVDDILYIKGLSDYIEIVTENSKLIIYESLKNVLLQLGDQDFLRVHKSWIIPVGRIDSIVGNNIHIGGVEIPIGRTYRKQLFEKVEARRIGK